MYKNSTFGRINSTYNTDWPRSIEMVRCDLLDAKGEVICQGEIKRPEYDLNTFIQSIKSKYKIKPADVKRLFDLIDNYGHDMFSEGSTDAFLSYED